MHNEKEMIKLMLEKGADGYLLKSSGADELAVALQRVMDGQKHFSSEVTMALLQPDKESEDHELLKDLTERELEVLKWIPEGLSNKEIGERLFISHRTVDTHRTNLMRKLEVNNVAGLIRIAFKCGLVED